MGPSDTTVSRRRVLAGFAAVATGAVAGCNGRVAPDGDAASPTSSPVGATGSPTPVSDGGPASPTSAPDEPFDDEIVERAREVGVSLRDSVVAIERDGEWIAGAGWYFGADDLLVTAAHVVDEAETLRGWLPDGTELALSTVGTAGGEGADVAAVRADATGPTLSAGSARDLTPGQPLVQVGNPRDVGYWTIAIGRFRAADPESDTFETTLPTAGGFSGGPTATLAGDVVGLLAGSNPIHRRPLGAVEPEPPTPYGPDDRLSDARHEPVEVVTDLVEGWTG